MQMKKQCGVVLMTTLFILSLLGLCIIFAAKLLNHHQHMFANHKFAYEDEVKQLTYLQQTSKKILQALNNGNAMAYTPQILGRGQNCELGLWNIDFLENDLIWQNAEHSYEIAFVQMDLDCNASLLAANNINHFWVLIRRSNENSHAIFAQNLYQGFDINGLAMNFTQPPTLTLP